MKLEEIVSKVGFELELCVKDDNYFKLEERVANRGARLKNDGSIRSRYIAKEIESRPRFMSDISELEKDIDVFTEIIEPSNNTMGFHVHVSFRLAGKGVHSLFTEKEVVQEFVKEYAKTFTQPPERGRLRNEHCVIPKRATSWDYTQKYLAIGASYSNVNHGTIEFRLFPSSNNPRKLKQYVEFALKFIEAQAKGLNKLPKLTVKSSTLASTSNTVMVRSVNGVSEKGGGEIEATEYLDTCALCGRAF